MASPFDGYEVEARMRPSADAYGFDLDRALSAVVALEARVPPDAFTAGTLGVQRLGNGTVIGPNGLVLTIGYLITEAEEVTLTQNDGMRTPAHVLGFDAVTGFGLVQALDPLGLPALPLGDSRALATDSPVILAGGGGRAHAAAGRVIARTPFAGYWEYFLDNAIITEPAHPHWSGAALIGSSGELVGVGSLSMERRLSSGKTSPINMFVPSELLAPILDDLARGKPAHPPRPWLGVISQEIGEHVVVIGVNPGGPAARAELRAGDFILAVGDVTVSTLADFYTGLWAQGGAGATIPLRVRRENDAFDVEIRSADRTAMLKKRRLN
ncbi:S1C family serine protease [Phenylobacterium sp.]|uniref:S1C family serine protease n=1 Tax=Phenylobacterium sp. TaxID=1871053 RepID=UPI0027341029|nr:S1C family serine protease [Phenylobacterium sp.]MDP3659084.1 S1C family serine protease [Phenylobacterium sp.]